MSTAPATGSLRILLRPSGLQFDADASQPLLKSARDAGIVLPSSCRNGTCRACLCRMLEGTVTYQVEWPGLSAQEKAEGWILPCVALAQTSLVIEAPRAQPL